MVKQKHCNVFNTYYVSSQEIQNINIFIGIGMQPAGLYKI